jgi:choline dehydrogenase-like flavoprotein
VDSRAARLWQAVRDAERELDVSVGTGARATRTARFHPARQGARRIELDQRSRADCGQREDFDEWGRLGYADVLPYFRKSEDYQHGECVYHGAGGPLAVEAPRERHPLCDAFIAAAGEIGIARNDDFNGERQEGRGLLSHHGSQRAPRELRRRLSATSGNSNAATIMIAQKAADLILAEAKRTYALTHQSRD